MGAKAEASDLQSSRKSCSYFTKFMAKVTIERFLAAVPKNPEFHITLPEMARRFGCSRTAVSDMARKLKDQGEIEVFTIYGATHHYKRKVTNDRI